MKTTMREERFLAACVRPDATLRSEVAGLVQSRVDWRRLVTCALHHKVLPLLHQVLMRESDVVPSDVLMDLRRRNTENATRNLLFSRELMRILRLLETKGIIAIPFKGPVLALSAYGSLGLRQFCDLDLLVRRADAQRAGEVLRTGGYQEHKPLRPLLHPRPCAWRRRLVYPGANENSYLHAKSGIQIDLHWDLHPGFFLPADGDQVWNRCRKAIFMGQEITVMSPEDTIIFLAIHAARDGWRTLGQFCDLAAFIRSAPVIDWRQLVNTANLMHVHVLVMLGLLVAFRHAGMPLPSGLVSRLRTPRVLAAGADVILYELFQPRRQHGVGFVSELVRATRMRDRWHEAIWNWLVMVRLVFTRTAEGPLRASVGTMAYLAFATVFLTVFSFLLPWERKGR